MSRAMDTVYTHSTHVYTPLCGCVRYVYMCKGACVHAVHIYGDLRLS